MSMGITNSPYPYRIERHPYRVERPLTKFLKLSSNVPTPTSFSLKSPVANAEKLNPVRFQHLKRSPTKQEPADAPSHCRVDCPLLKPGLRLIPARIGPQRHRSHLPTPFICTQRSPQAKPLEAPTIPQVLQEISSDTVKMPEVRFALGAVVSSPNTQLEQANPSSLDNEDNSSRSSSSSSFVDSESSSSPVFQPLVQECILTVPGKASTPRPKAVQANHLPLDVPIDLTAVISKRELKWISLLMKEENTKDLTTQASQVNALFVNQAPCPATQRTPSPPTQRASASPKTKPKAVVDKKEIIVSLDRKNALEIISLRNHRYVSRELMTKAHNTLDGRSKSILTKQDAENLTKYNISKDLSDKASQVLGRV